MESFKSKKINTCTSCGSTVNAFTATTSGTKPSEGSLLICVYCGTISWIQEDFSLKPVTAEDLVDIFMKDQEAYEEIIKAQTAVKKLIILHNIKPPHKR